MSADEHAITADPNRFKVPEADDLRELRLISGLSVQEIADRVGCSTESIRRWECGDFEPRVSDARAFLDACRSEVSR